MKRLTLLAAAGAGAVGLGVVLAAVWFVREVNDALQTSGLEPVPDPSVPPPGWSIHDW